MSYDNIGEKGRELLIQSIKSTLSKSYSKVEAFLLLAWYYELILSAVAEKNNVGKVSFNNVKMYFMEASSLMDILKRLRDAFVHFSKLPTDNHLSRIKVYAKNLDFNSMVDISGLPLENVLLIEDILNSL